MGSASIAIVGMGAVGTACAAALLQGGLCHRLGLYDRNPARAQGEALDFLHAAPMMPACEVRAGGLDQIEPADLAIVCAGAHTAPGQTRLDVLDANLAAIGEVAAALDASGLPPLVMVVTNPVDVLSEYLRRRWASQETKVFGTGTSLDSFRLQERLALALGVHPDSVHAWVIGEHGDSAVFLFSSATIGSFRLGEWAEIRGVSLDPLLAEVERDVRTAAYRVIQLKGAAVHGISLATLRLVECLVREPGKVLPVSIPVADDVCASAPTVIGHGGPAEPLWPAMDERERDAWTTSLSVLRGAGRHLPLQRAAESRVAE